MNDTEKDAEICEELCLEKEHHDPSEKWLDIKEESIEYSDKADDCKFPASMLPIKQEPVDESIPDSSSKALETNFGIYQDAKITEVVVKYSTKSDTTCDYQLTSLLPPTDQELMEDLPHTEEVRTSTCKKTIPGISREEASCTSEENCDSCENWMEIKEETLDYSTLSGDKCGVHVEEKPYMCEICNKSFSQKEVLVEHMQIHTEEILLLPQESPTGISQEEASSSYEKQKNSKSEEDLSENWVEIDVANFIDDDVFSGDSCDAQSPSLSPLPVRKENPGKKKQTKTKKKRGKQFTCNVCNKALAHKNSLLRHMRIHTEDRFSCDVCKKTFCRKDGLVAHMRVHTKEHPCDICNITFARKEFLLEHMRMHTGEISLLPQKTEEDASEDWLEIKEENFSYDTCSGESCQSPLPEGKGSPIETQQADAKKRKFTCDTCNKSFVTKTNLTRHVRIHTGDRFSCDVCKKTFCRKDGLVAHMRVHTKEHPCDICNITFARKEFLLEHMRMHTGEISLLPQKTEEDASENWLEIKEENFSYDACSGESCQSPLPEGKGSPIETQQAYAKKRKFTCDTCNKSFLSKPSLSRHIRIHTEKSQFTCDICKMTFSQKEALVGHMQLHTKEKPNSCDICHKSFSQKEFLVEHMQKHTGEIPFTCDICSMPFARKLNLVKHMQLHSKERPYMCNVCEKSFRKKETLAGHMLVHSNKKRYTCNECNKTFYRKTMLKDHMRVHTKEKPYSCDICNKTFTQNASLWTHKLIHTKNPFRCEICNKHFSAESMLEEHMQIHSKDNPYSCDICNQHFMFKYMLLVHKQTHKNEEQFKCDMCPKVYSFKKEFQIHMRMHTNEKPFVCETCNRAFNYKGSLELHMRIHKKEKPFTCKICDKSFTVKCSLVTHMRVHTKEKPYTCDICYRSFRQTGVLAQHKLSIHTNERPFICEICKKSFNAKDILKRHMKFVHK